ncbi:LuxR C-terminal-related transcriptional regulator [Streptomyces sp. NPDC053048]|uniref:LuxR C-terminal-related transcriptional regulator n=1 Tax=Streptomyces sp. NPDC053048 TaxID=3365694 RepID=UPI0037CE561F
MVFDQSSEERRRRRAWNRAVHAARTAVDPVVVFEDAVPELAETLGFDVWAGVLLDPVTLLNTGGTFRHGVSAAWMPRMLDIEYREGDVLQMPALARQATPVGSLASSLGGLLERSVRYRDIYRPLGLGDEIRVLLKDAGRVWGALVLVRDAHRPPFSASDMAFVAGLSQPLGRALRRSLAVPGKSLGKSLGNALGAGESALVLLDEEYTLLSASAAAESWFTELAEAPARGKGLPASAYSVAAATLRSGSGGSRACVPMRAGGWAAIEGWRLETGEGLKLALTISPASPPDQATSLLRAYGLTPRETDVLVHVLRGASTGEISARLAVSPYTVQDHLKSVFDKTGTHSRRELVGQVFFQHYLPEVDSLGPDRQPGSG